MKVTILDTRNETCQPNIPRRWFRSDWRARRIHPITRLPHRLRGRMPLPKLTTRIAMAVSLLDALNTPRGEQ